MKFYKLHRTTDAGSSAGYEFYTNKREAEKAAQEWRTEYPDERATVEEITIQPTRAGILGALNRFASHPDNG